MMRLALGQQDLSGEEAGGVIPQEVVSAIDDAAQVVMAERERGEPRFLDGLADLIAGDLLVVVDQHDALLGPHRVT